MSLNALSKASLPKSSLPSILFINPFIMAKPKEKRWFHFSIEMHVHGVMVKAEDKQAVADIVKQQLVAGKIPPLSEVFLKFDKGGKCPEKGQ